MGIIERISQFREHLGIGQTAFEVNVGVAKGYFSKVKTLGSDKIIGIYEKYPQLNIEWLITGNGYMVKDDEYNQRDCTQKTMRKDIPHYEELSTKAVPHIDIISAECGLPSGFSSAIMKEQCEHYVIPDLDGCDFTIRAKGRSMINRTVPERSINNRDIVGCKIVKGTLPIQWGEVYALATSDGVVIKKIQKSKENGCVSCVSYNTDDGYEPYDIPVNEIYDWALVIGVVRIARWL